MSAEERLIKCFAAVFPELDEQQIRSATPTSVSSWDSVATITLMSVIEEEFGIEVDSDHLEQLLSFDSALAYVSRS